MNPSYERGAASWLKKREGLHDPCRAHHLLLVCGIVSSVLYGAMIAAIRFDGYSRISQTPSELTAIGRRPVRCGCCSARSYTILVTAFGWGVWKAAGRDPAVRFCRQPAGGLRMPRPPVAVCPDAPA